MHYPNPELLDAYPRLVALYRKDFGDTGPAVYAALADTEALRLNKYPQYTRDQWDLIQAEELFDDNGEPLAHPFVVKRAFDGLRGEWTNQPTKEQGESSEHRDRFP